MYAHYPLIWQCKNNGRLVRLPKQDPSRIHFHCASGFEIPKTCAHARLLGPCFKTGLMGNCCNRGTAAFATTTVPGFTTLRLFHKARLTRVEPTAFSSPSVGTRRIASTTTEAGLHVTVAPCQNKVPRRPLKNAADFKAQAPTTLVPLTYQPA